MNPLNALKLMNSKEPFTQEERFFKPCSFSTLGARFDRTPNCLETSLIEVTGFNTSEKIAAYYCFDWILIIASFSSDLFKQTNDCLKLIVKAIDYFVAFCCECAQS